MTYIKNFTELKVWQKAHKITLEIYKITNSFPVYEKYCLVSQIRRAAISVPSNLVEGFHKHSNKESVRFCYYSLASLEEMKYQLLIARDLDYINAKRYNEIMELCNEVGKMLNGWIKSQKVNIVN